MAVCLLLWITDGLQLCRFTGDLLQGHGRGLYSHHPSAQVCLILTRSIVRVLTSMWVAGLSHARIMLQIQECLTITWSMSLH